MAPTYATGDHSEVAPRPEHTHEPAPILPRSPDPTPQPALRTPALLSVLWATVCFSPGLSDWRASD